MWGSQQSKHGGWTNGGEWKKGLEHVCVDTSLGRQTDRHWERLLRSSVCLRVWLAAGRAHLLKRYWVSRQDLTLKISCPPFRINRREACSVASVCSYWINDVGKDVTRQDPQLLMWERHEEIRGFSLCSNGTLAPRWCFVVSLSILGPRELAHSLTHPLDAVFSCCAISWICPHKHCVTNGPVSLNIFGVRPLISYSISSTCEVCKHSNKLAKMRLKI